MGQFFPQTKLVTRKSYGLSGSMGYGSYGLGGSRLYHICLRSEYYIILFHEVCIHFAWP